MGLQGGGGGEGPFVTVDFESYVWLGGTADFAHSKVDANLLCFKKEKLMLVGKKNIKNKITSLLTSFMYSSKFSELANFQLPTKVSISVEELSFFFNLF